MASNEERFQNFSQDYTNGVNLSPYAQPFCVAEFFCDDLLSKCDELNPKLNLKRLDMLSISKTGDIQNKHNRHTLNSRIDFYPTRVCYLKAEICVNASLPQSVPKERVIECIKRRSRDCPLVHGIWENESEECLYVEMAKCIWRSQRLDNGMSSRRISMLNNDAAGSLDRLQTLKISFSNSMSKPSRWTLEHQAAQFKLCYQAWALLLFSALRLGPADVAFVIQTLERVGISSSITEDHTSIRKLLRNHSPDASAAQSSALDAATFFLCKVSSYDHLPVSSINSRGTLSCPGGKLYALMTEASLHAQFDKTYHLLTADTRIVQGEYGFAILLRSKKAAETLRRRRPSFFHAGTHFHICDTELQHRRQALLVNWQEGEPSASDIRGVVSSLLEELGLPPTSRFVQTKAFQKTSRWFRPDGDIEREFARHVLSPHVQTAIHQAAQESRPREDLNQFQEDETVEADEALNSSLENLKDLLNMPSRPAMTFVVFLRTSLGDKLKAHDSLPRQATSVLKSPVLTCMRSEDLLFVCIEQCSSTTHPLRDRQAFMLLPRHQPICILTVNPNRLTRVPEEIDFALENLVGGFWVTQGLSANAETWCVVDDNVVEDLKEEVRLSTEFARDSSFVNNRLRTIVRILDGIRSRDMTRNQTDDQIDEISLCQFDERPDYQLNQTSHSQSDERFSHQIDTLRRVLNQVFISFERVVICSRISGVDEPLEDHAYLHSLETQSEFLESLLPLHMTNKEFLRGPCKSAACNEWYDLIEEKLQDQSGKRTIFISVSLDRMARSKQSLVRLNKLLEDNNHAALALMWDYTTRVDAQLALRLDDLNSGLLDVWRRCVEEQIRVQPTDVSALIVQPIIWAGLSPSPAVLAAVERSISRSDDYCKSRGVGRFMGPSTGMHPAFERDANSSEFDDSDLDRWKAEFEEFIPEKVNVAMLYKHGSDAWVCHCNTSYGDHDPNCRCRCTHCEDMRLCACRYQKKCECPLFCNCKCLFCHKYNKSDSEAQQIPGFLMLESRYAEGVPYKVQETSEKAIAQYQSCSEPGCKRKARSLEPQSLRHGNLCRGCYSGRRSCIMPKCSQNVTPEGSFTYCNAHAIGFGQYNSKQTDYYKGQSSGKRNRECIEIQDAFPNHERIICIVEGCGKPAGGIGRVKWKHCHKHMCDLAKNKDAQTALSPNARRCTFEECNRIVRADGTGGEFCSTHELQRKRVDPKSRRCRVEGCNKPAPVGGTGGQLCFKHISVRRREREARKQKEAFVSP